jgi:hypothetical protein
MGGRGPRGKGEQKTIVIVIVRDQTFLFEYGRLPYIDVIPTQTQKERISGCRLLIIQLAMVMLDGCPNTVASKGPDLVRQSFCRSSTCAFHFLSFAS